MMNRRSRIGWLNFFFSTDSSEKLKIFAAPFILIGVAIVMGFLLFMRSESLMKEQLRDRLRVTSEVGALQIDPLLVEQVRTEGDMDTAAYKRLLGQVQAIRDADPLILFAYIMRRTEDPNVLSFVVDADNAVPRQKLDRDLNGIIEDDEEPALPGESYDVSGGEFSVLRIDAFAGGAVDEQVTEDKWGSYISGYAPIRDASGNTVAILGLDMDAGKFFSISQSIFSPIIYLIVILTAFVLAGYLLFVWNRHNVNTLKQIDKERSGLLQLTFHQLGEPITIMQWSLESLSENLTLDQLEHLVPEHITTMNEGLRRLNGIIDTLQFAEKIDLGSIDFKSELITLKPLLDEVVIKYRTILDASQQVLSIQCDANLTAHADREYLKVVLSEVIGNAIAYSTKNCKVDVHVHPERRTVHIDIQDHGCGIPKKDLPRLFEKYMRGSNAHLHKPDGNGLGLYICKGIVDGMNGTIAIESIEDVGTKVSITLPL